MKLVLSLVSLFLATTFAYADCHKSKARKDSGCVGKLFKRSKAACTGSAACTGKSAPVPQSQPLPKPPEAKPAKPIGTGSDDALDEVNAARAKRGLRPFQRDGLLTRAAAAVARKRAERLIQGHLPEGDYRYLPEGATAAAAGCAAWTPDWGWGSCCTYDDYTYAGAAWVMGPDNKRYMQLFVR